MNATELPYCWLTLRWVDHLSADNAADSFWAFPLVIKTTDRTQTSAGAFDQIVDEEWRDLIL